MEDIIYEFITSNNLDADGFSKDVFVKALCMMMKDEKHIFSIGSPLKEIDLIYVRYQNKYNDNSSPLYNYLLDKLGKVA
jgi:hypothetical protein